MTDHWREHRDASIAQLEGLIQRGLQIKELRASDAIRSWQQDCAATVHQLSGGSKAHWLSRGYSNALLVRSPSGAVVVEADAMEIVDRIIGVLTEGVTSLSRMTDAAEAAATQPPRRQFEFVHNAEMRPILEQAFVDSRAALDRGEAGLALILSCSIIESIITDALVHAAGREAPPSDMGIWSFEKRIAEAERAGLIRGGCARLPASARRYRELTEADGSLRADVQVSEGDARLAGQVLKVVMRDLNPGR